MASDTPESRLARVEERVDSNRRQIDVFGPLPLAVERVQWSIDAINTRLDKRDREDTERFEKLARSFENQITACSNAVAQVADSQREWQEAEDDRRNEEAKTVRVERTQDIVSRRTLYGVLGAAGLAAFAAIVAPILNAIFG